MRHGAEDNSMATQTGQTPAQRRASDVASGRMVLLRREPIDFRRVAEESGLSKGKIVHSPHFGWGVQNTHGIDGPSFGCITPPALQPGETWISLASPHWCFYGPRRASETKQENDKI